jgi:hypothetical protein
MGNEPAKKKKKIWPDMYPLPFSSNKPAVAGRLAVVYPLAGREKLTFAGVRRVTRSWWRRVRELKEVGYEPVGGRGLFPYYCPPRASVSVRLRGRVDPRPCHLRGCPWCHAAWVGSAYQRVAEATTGRLVFLRRRTAVAYDRFTVTDVRSACRDAAAAVAEAAGGRGAAGGLWRVTVDPQTGGAAVVASAVVLVTRSGVTVPGWEAIETDAASPEKLERRVADALRYPVGLIRGTVEHARLALTVTAGLRLSGVQGAFRKKGTTNKDTCDDS